MINDSSIDHSVMQPSNPKERKMVLKISTSLADLLELDKDSEPLFETRKSLRHNTLANAETPSISDINNEVPPNNRPKTTQDFVKLVSLNYQPKPKTVITSKHLVQSNHTSGEPEWSVRDEKERRELESLQSKLQVVRCHLNLDIYEEVNLSTEIVMNTILFKIKESLDTVFERSIHINRHFSQVKDRLERLDPDMTNFDSLFHTMALKKLNEKEKEGLSLSSVQQMSFQDLLNNIQKRVLDTDQNVKEYAKRFTSLQKMQAKKWMELENKLDQKQAIIDNLKQCVCECKREQIERNANMNDPCSCLQTIIKLRMQLDEKPLIDKELEDTTADPSTQIKRLSHLLQEKSTQASNALDQVKFLKGQTLVDTVLKNDQQELIQELRDELVQKELEIKKRLEEKISEIPNSPIERVLREKEADLETALQQLNRFGKEKMDDLAYQQSLKKQINNLISEKEGESKELKQQLEDQKKQMECISLENQNLRVSNAELKIKLKNEEKIQKSAVDLNDTLASKHASKKESEGVFKGLSSVEFDFIVDKDASSLAQSTEDSVVEIHDYGKHPFFIIYIAVLLYQLLSTIMDYVFYEKPE